jgi:hypothetical protein
MLMHRLLALVVAWVVIILCPPVYAQVVTPSPDQIVAHRDTGTRSVPQQSFGYRDIAEYPVLYDIRILNVASTTVKAYDDGSNVFVPLPKLLEFVKAQYVIAPTGTSVTIGGKSFPLIEARTFWAQDTIYVLLSDFAATLGIEAIVYREDASIVFTNTQSLPIVRDLARAEARAALRTTLSERESHSALVQNKEISPSPSWGDLLLDYTFYQHRTAFSSGTNVSLSAGTILGPGTLLAHFSDIGLTRHSDIAWFAVWPTTRELKQLRLGYGTSSGLSPLSIRGIYLSNAPIARRSNFNTLFLTGALPPDWSIEAYRDGVLVSFDSIGTTGQYTLPVPVQYGENPFELIAYSPSGEALRFGRMIRTPTSLLPAGELEFAASTGACVSFHCQWMMNLDLRYGLTRRWSIRGGATEYRWRESKNTNVYPYFTIDGVLAQGLTLSTEFMRSSHAKMGLSWDPTPRFTLISDYTTYPARDADMSALVGTNMRAQFWTFTRFTPPRLRSSLEAQFTRVETTTNTHTFFRFGTSIPFSTATFRPYFRINQTQHSRTQSTGLDALISGSSIGFSAWTLRSTVEATSMGSLSYAELAFARSNMFRFTGEAGIRWRPNTTPLLTFALTTDIGQVRTQTQALASTSGQLQSVQQAHSGSLRWDTNTRQLIRTPNPNFDRAGVSGIVFLDVNNNNTFDESDQVIPNVSVRIDNTTVTTNARGYYELWGIIPGQLITVSIDSATLFSPWWIPTKPSYHITTAPNRATPLNIPLTTSSILEGTIITTPGCSSTTFTLKHNATSRTYTITPFSDDTFYQMSLLPGVYTIHSSCNTFPKEVTLSPNRSTTIELKLTPKSQ